MITTMTRPAEAPAIDSRIQQRIDLILNRWATVGLAVGVVRDGRFELFRGHGMADIESKSPITVDTVFRIASISKTLTAIAVMQLWEQGLIDLDASANEYLHAFKLIAARPSFRPATVRHLLTHTSGLPEMVKPSRSLGYIFGESYALDERVPRLADYYGHGLRVTADPGTRFTYTDHNFSTLGQIVEDVTRLPLDRYMREHIFDPLGMASTDLLRSGRVVAHLATGYTLAARGPKPVTDRQWLTAAASMVYSSPRDMARYLAALMNGGANDHGSVLEPATLAMMFEPQYRPDSRVAGIGLAFDRATIGGHRAAGHEGILPGFNSQIWVAPDDGVGVMAFTNGARLAMLWLPGEIASLLGVALQVPDDVVRRDVPQHPEIWNELCGWYPFEGALTDLRARALMGAGAQVFSRRGELVLRIVSPVPAAYRGFVLHPDDPDDPYVFRVDLSQFGIPAGRVVFSREQETTRICVDMLPVSLAKKPAGQHRIGPWLVAAAGALAVAGVVKAVKRKALR